MHEPSPYEAVDPGEVQESDDLPQQTRVDDCADRVHAVPDEHCQEDRDESRPAATHHLAKSQGAICTSQQGELIPVHRFGECMDDMGTDEPRPDCQRDCCEPSGHRLADVLSRHVIRRHQWLRSQTTRNIRSAKDDVKSNQSSAQGPWRDR